MEILLSVGLGLMVLGLGFIVIDFFLVRLLRKMHADPNCWIEEPAAPDLRPEDRRTFVNRRRLFDAAASHRLRNWGVIVFVVGALLCLALAIITPGIFMTLKW